jgi:limonene-1,2-epoxide hydrolase
MENQNPQIMRRAFLGMSALGAVSAGLPPQAAEWTAQEKMNVEIVKDFCAAWSTRDMEKPLAFLTQDCVYRMSETTPPVNGHEGVVQRLKSYVDATDLLEFKIFETFAKGPIVMNHRIDSFVSKTRPLTWEGVGVFLIQNGKIKEWSDYTIRVNR